MNRFLTLAGAIPWLAAYPLYLLGALLSSQVGWVRTAGAFLVFDAALLGAAAALALAGRAWGRSPGPVARAAAELGFLAMALGGVVGVGLAVWYRSAPLAPGSVRLGAAALIGLLLLNLARAGAADRGQAVRSFVALGLAAHLALGATLPVVAWAAATDVPEVQGRPRVPASPRLRPDAPPRVVLITFDSLTARRTSLHRPALDTTPNLARLAAQGTSYAAFRPAADTTTASLSAILTGLGAPRLYAGHAHRSGARRLGSTEGLAAFLRAAGYRTYAATMLVEPATVGLAAEFDESTFSSRFLPPSLNTHAFLPLAPAWTWLANKVRRVPDPDVTADRLRSTRRTFERAAAYYRRPEARSFVWLHLAPPHAPYLRIPRKDLGRDLQERDYPPRHPLPADAANGFADVWATYDDFLRYADAELGRFLDGLRQDPRWRDTLVVVTGDHGEELISGYDVHANGLLTEDVAHVPLVVRAPGDVPGGVVALPASHVDLAPTVLARVYAELPAGFDGVPLAGKAGLEGRTVFVWGLYGRHFEGTARPQNVAAYAGRHKLLLTVPTGAAALFDLGTDPDARRDVAAAHPALVARLRREAESFLGTRPGLPVRQDN